MNIFITIIFIHLLFYHHRSVVFIFNIKINILSLLLRKNIYYKKEYPEDAKTINE
jgi:hypothetical protein